MERSEDNGEGYESRLQGFVGGDTRGNIVRHTDCTLNVTKMEVGRVVGGLSSKSKKRELVVRNV